MPTYDEDGEMLEGAWADGYGHRVHCCGLSQMNLKQKIIFSHLVYQWDAILHICLLVDQWDAIVHNCLTN
jgi:hypothetical protein